MRGFRTHWKLWNLLFSILLISIFITISAQTQEGDSRFIAILLYPVATAAFINWEWQWQALMGLACLVLYGIAQLLVPLPSDSVYRWFGLLAAIALAQCISFFIGVYRQRLDAQVNQLRQAAAFRESQIATMAHDIRSRSPRSRALSICSMMRTSPRRIARRFCRASGLQHGRWT